MVVFFTLFRLSGAKISSINDGSVGTFSSFNGTYYLLIPFRFHFGQSHGTGPAIHIVPWYTWASDLPKM